MIYAASTKVVALLRDRLILEQFHAGLAFIVFTE
jgi:hypothetical protein